MAFLALYLVSVSTRLKSISRPGRTKEYSPTRRVIITAARIAKLCAPDRKRKPVATANGTAVSRAPIPNFEAMRPVKTICAMNVRLWTVKSSCPKTRVRMAGSANVSETMRSCAK